MPAIKHQLPATKINFPESMWTQGDPKPATGPVKSPDRNNKLQYGEYLATISHCEVCHSPHPGLREDVSLRFAGGRTFTTPAGVVVSANITPDKATGIGDWDVERFKKRLKTYQEYENADGPPKIGPDRFTMMPYEAYAHMDDYDMEAIFAYLMTRPPITNKVDPHPGSAKRDEP
jgi:hypothetical protein